MRLIIINIINISSCQHESRVSSSTPFYTTPTTNTTKLGHHLSQGSRSPSPRSSSSAFPAPSNNAFTFLNTSKRPAPPLRTFTAKKRRRRAGKTWEYYGDPRDGDAAYAKELYYLLLQDICEVLGSDEQHPYPS